MKLGKNLESCQHLLTLAAEHRNEFEQRIADLEAKLATAREALEELTKPHSPRWVREHARTAWEKLKDD